MNIMKRCKYNFGFGFYSWEMDAHAENSSNFASSSAHLFSVYTTVTNSLNCLWIFLFKWNLCIAYTWNCHFLVYPDRIVKWFAPPPTPTAPIQFIKSEFNSNLIPQLLRKCAHRHVNIWSYKEIEGYVQHSAHYLELNIKKYRPHGYPQRREF